MSSRPDSHDETLLEFTPSGIPISLRPHLQEYVLESLDPERDSFTIIERTLAWGEVGELRWLFGRYGAAPLRELVQRYGWRVLPRRSFKYWLTYFQIQEYSAGERVWSH